MSKYIVRYFYSPICPESFATLKRLKNLFQDDKKFFFESFNTALDNPVSEFPWFPEEREILATLEGKKGKPLFFGKLFVEGEEIKGFPPSPKSLKEVFGKYEIDWNSDFYHFNYESIEREKWKCKQKDFFFQSYFENLSFDICRLCTKYHPYLDEKNYNQNEWIKHEKQKLSFLFNKLNENKLIGIIAYYKQEPAGFVESFSLDIASKLGFPVSKLTDKSLMITCLTIRTELSGNGLGTKLIKELEKEAKKNNYKTIEVISFPDEHNWHPKSFYKMLGYKEVKKIKALSMLKKTLY